MCTWADAEALLGDHEVTGVRVQVGVDLAELHVRVVVRLDRLLELDVELVNLRQHGLGLRALRLDRVRRRRARGEKRNAPRPRLPQGGRDACRLRGRHAPSQPPAERRADGGVTGHKSGSLAATDDDCTANRREKSANSEIRVVRSAALCRGARDTSCRAPRSSSSDATTDLAPAHPRPTEARGARDREAPGGARALRRRVDPRARARGRRAARTPAAGSRCEACAHPAPRHGRPQLARRRQPAGRQPAAPAVCRGRCGPDRSPARRSDAAGDARLRLDELERTTHANRGIAAELRARSRTLRAHGRACRSGARSRAAEALERGRLWRAYARARRRRRGESPAGAGLRAGSAVGVGANRRRSV